MCYCFASRLGRDHSPTNVDRSLQLRAATVQLRRAALQRQEAARWLFDYASEVIMRGGRAGFQGASDVGEQVVCAECSDAIDVGAGRFNIGSRSYHVKCYDASRHLTVPESA